FVDPATGEPLPFDEAVTSGLGVGVPGTLAQWELALRRFGSRDLGTLLRPAIRVAERGFVVDREVHDQTALNADRFRDIVPTGAPPPCREAVTSGLGVGVPGTLAQWELALRRFGSRDLGTLLRPAIRVAERGFVVDREFHDQTALNADRFRDIVPTRELFLPDGKVPAVGSVFRNPDLARTYRELARRGTGWFYGGGLGKEIVRTVAHPPVAPGADRRVRPGLMSVRDLEAYRAVPRTPTRVAYRGLDVYGMPPSSSGGTTVGEALNIMGDFRLDARDPAQALHYYLE